MPPRYWDVSTREKALGAYMEMFKIEDEQWNSFCGGEEVEPRLKSTYRAAKAGDARAAYLLFNDLRPPGTFGSFSLELIETVVYEAPPTLPSEDLTEPEPPPPEVLLKDAFLTAKWESVEIGGAIKELTETLSSIAL